MWRLWWQSIVKADVMAVRWYSWRLLCVANVMVTLTCKGVFGKGVPFMRIPEYRPVIRLRNILPHSLHQLRASAAPREQLITIGTWKDCC